MSAHKWAVCVSFPVGIEMLGVADTLADIEVIACGLSIGLCK